MDQIISNEVISRSKVYDLPEAIYASGYPMLSEYPSDEEYNKNIDQIIEDINRGAFSNPHLGRALKLANARGGGHDQFLSGVLVSFDLTFENKLWVEAERYKFLVFVSSFSTMHRASKLNIAACSNEFVDPDIVKIVERLQREYNDDPTSNNYLRLLFSLPAGFKITARMTTNYRCLKNIYQQRKSHLLPQWHLFCEWIESLPLAKELICKG